MDERGVRYMPKYCEENIWFLCQEPLLVPYQRRVVFISNAHQACAFWHQKSSRSSKIPVLWDYHVVLLCRQSQWMVWDLDTTLGLPLGAGAYLDKSFALSDTLLRHYAPIFRVVEVADFLETFSSDRSHMLDRDGKWLAAPPAWEPIQIGDTVTLNRFIDMRGEWVGDVMDLEGMQRRYGNGGR